MKKRLGEFAGACSLICLLGSLPAFPAAAQESVAGQSEAANGQWPEAANSQSEEAAAQAQVGPSQQDQLEGELEIVHQDFEDGRGRYLYFLKVPDGTQVPLHFIKEPPTHVLTGDHVRVSGQLSSGSLILYSGSTNVKKTGGGNNNVVNSRALHLRGPIDDNHSRQLSR